MFGITVRRTFAGYSGQVNVRINATLIYDVFPSRITKHI
jgi:hypothetical protein